MFRLAASIVQYNYAAIPFEEALASIARLGIAGVETNAPPHVLARGTTELRRLLERHSLQPATYLMGGYGVDCGVGSLSEGDDEQIAATLANYRHHIAVARSNGFERMVIFPGFMPRAQSLDQAMARTAPFLREVAAAAAEQGVEILIETHDGALASDSTTFLDLRQRAGGTNIFANVDPSNYLVVGDDVQQAVRSLGPLVRGVHIKDVVFQDATYAWAPAGRGSVDFRGLLEALRDIAYRNWFVVEYEAGIAGRFSADAEQGTRDDAAYIAHLLNSQ